MWCTPDLRSDAALEAAGVLPTESPCFSEALGFAHLPSWAKTPRVAWRKQWLSRGVAATEECELVCVDPDNGVRLSDHGTPSHRNKTEKHAYFDELLPFIGRGQSLVAYHHADRSTVDRQAHLVWPTPPSNCRSNRWLLCEPHEEQLDSSSFFQWMHIDPIFRATFVRLSGRPGRASSRCIGGLPTE